MARIRAINDVCNSHRDVIVYSAIFKNLGDCINVSRVERMDELHRLGSCKIDRNHLSAIALIAAN